MAARRTVAVVRTGVTFGNQRADGRDSPRHTVVAGIGRHSLSHPAEHRRPAVTGELLRNAWLQIGELRRLDPRRIDMELHFLQDMCRITKQVQSDA